MSDPKQWDNLALEDCRVARLLVDEGVFRPACFHAQQAVEKALKGFLILRTNAYPKTHLLRELLSLCDLADAGFRQWVEDCHFLDRFYRVARYPDAAAGALPGGDPTREDAERAARIAESMLRFVKDKVAQ
jgi:HEPN domain-containing protein